jgi:hypothetical protein
VRFLAAGARVSFAETVSGGNPLEPWTWRRPYGSRASGQPEWSRHRCGPVARTDAAPSGGGSPIRGLPCSGSFRIRQATRRHVTGSFDLVAVGETDPRERHLPRPPGRPPRLAGVAPVRSPVTGGPGGAGRCGPTAPLGAHPRSPFVSLTVGPQPPPRPHPARPFDGSPNQNSGSRQGVCNAPQRRRKDASTGERQPRSLLP